jgi:hypothetical protein
LIPRLIIGLIAANFAVPLCSNLIQAANAVTAAFTGQDISAPDSRHLRATTLGAVNGQTGVGAASFLLLVIALLMPTQPTSTPGAAAEHPHPAPTPRQTPTLRQDRHHDHTTEPRPAHGRTVLRP